MPGDKREKNPYALADETISSLDRKAVRRFDKCESVLLIDGFDELNVLKSVRALYSGLDGDNQKAYRELFIERYMEVYESAKGEAAKEDELDDLATMYLAGLLGEPDPVTRYAYDAEVLRKRDRCAEGVHAANGTAEKRTELVKALRFWSQMTGQYADNICEGANVRALKDAGVKYVRWHTQEDERVCATCGKRDGKLYPIGSVPDKPHWRCRCWVSAA